jgi:hypothetical protein
LALFFPYKLAGSGDEYHFTVIPINDTATATTGNAVGSTDSETAGMICKTWCVLSNTQKLLKMMMIEIDGQVHLPVQCYPCVNGVHLHQIKCNEWLGDGSHACVLACHRRRQ